MTSFMDAPSLKVWLGSKYFFLFSDDFECQSCPTFYTNLNNLKYHQELHHEVSVTKAEWMEISDLKNAATPLKISCDDLFYEEKK